MRCITTRSQLALPLAIVILISLSAITMASSAVIWSVQVPYLGSNGLPHDFTYFKAIKELGYNTIFLTVPWGSVEYGPNEYDFKVLDTYMNYTRALGLNVILVFFYSVSAASGDPNPIPTWLLANGELEVNPYGDPQSPPALAWWNMTDRRYYFDFIKTVVSRYVNYSNFLGVLIDYGWLDDDWGPGVGGLPTGYAKSDVAMFRLYLNRTYGGNITALNLQWHTAYRSFNDVTPSLPFMGNWPYFQLFRVWSINETYSELFGMIRSIIGPDRMLLFYWGGSIDDIYGLQMPELYFQLARKYNVTIVLDDADHTKFAIFFSNLASVYGVHLMMEWTPVPSTSAYYGRYVSHIMLGYPWLMGGDYYVFIRSLSWFWTTTQLNAMAAEVYRLINGSHPKTSVAVLYVTMYGETYNQWKHLEDETYLISTGLVKVGDEYAYYPYNIVTADELELGLVNLSRYRYLILMVPESYIPSGVMSIINKWRVSGGVLIPYDSSWLTTGLGTVLPNIEEPVLTTNASVEVFPIVNANSAYISFNDYGNPINALHVNVNLTALGLPNGTYAIINLNGGDLLNITSDGMASFNLGFYYTQGAVLVGIIPIKPMHLLVNLTSIKATYGYNGGVFKVSLSGMLIPRLSGCSALALMHTNLTEFGAPFTSDGLVYESIGAGEARIKDGYFTVNLTLPLYQLMFNSYTLVLNLYTMCNGLIVSGESYQLSVNLTFAMSTYGSVPSVTGVGVTSMAPIFTVSPPSTTTTVSTTTTTVTSTITLITTMVKVSTLTTTLTSTVARYVLTKQTTAALIIGVIVLVIVLMIILGNVFRQRPDLPQP